MNFASSSNHDEMLSFIRRSEVGFIRNSALSNVRCKYIEAQDCVLINVTAERIVARPGSIIYNYIHQGGGDNADADAGAAASGGGGGTVGSQSLLEAREKDVIVGIFDETGKQMVVRSHLDIDGGRAWDDPILGNVGSFAGIHSSNVDACPIALQQVIGDAHNSLWKALTNA